MDSRPRWVEALRRFVANTPPEPKLNLPASHPMFGTVRQLNPLRIALDNDPTTWLPYTPPCLDYPTRVGQRVWVETYNGRVVVVGVARGTPDLPVGTGAIWTGQESPDLPWMLAEGQALSRTEFPEAFAVWGTTHGAPDSTRFNIPDVRGKMIVGRNTAEAEFDTIGETGGAKTHTLTTNEMPSHTHGGSGGNFAVLASGTYGLQASSNVPIGQVSTTAANGGGQPHNNMPPYIVERYMVKVR